MSRQKIVLLMSFCFVLLFFTASSVCAIDDNSTGQLTIEDNMDIESSDADDVVSVDSEDKLNVENEFVLESTVEDNLSDAGEFVDPSEGYAYLNAFRTESGVWQWNKDDTTKTVFNTNESNQLQPLIISSALEETAKIRAKELVQKYAHERPDGNDCFSAFPDGWQAVGENIAYGQTSWIQVTEAWEETNDPYSGQGHRRNMLNPNFNCVGVAGYKLNGVIYWVQDFGKYSDIPVSTSSTTKTEIKKETPSITAKKATFKVKKKSKNYSITLKAGKKAVKNVVVKIKIGKKTFKATTKSNGVAVFKIKLNKKGTYSSKITFNGNKYYKAISKKVTIKIK